HRCPYAGGNCPCPLAAPCGRRAASDCARDGCRPCGLANRPCSQAAAAPAGATGLPFGLALAAASHPLARGLDHDLTVASRPSSWLPSLRKCSKNA
ncbi:hypothetical protein BHE74_00014655, partial [Ensete ventricosum]